MHRAHFIALALTASLAGQRSFAQEIDFTEYEALVEQSIRAHTEAQVMPDVSRSHLLEVAIERDRTLITWLDSLIGSPEFAGLDTASRDAFLEARVRAELNRVAALIQVNRCAEARDRLAVLHLREDLRVHTNAQLDGLVTASTACLEQVSIPSWRHSADDKLALANPVLPAPPEPAAPAEAAAPPADPEPSMQLADDESAPYWHEWTLWGVGLAAASTAVVLVLIASDVEDQIENPPAGHHASDLGAEQAFVDDHYTAAWIAGGAGIVSAALGTILYLARQSDNPGREPDTQAWLGLGTAGVTVRF